MSNPMITAMLRHFGLDPAQIQAQLATASQQVNATVAHFDARLSRIENLLHQLVQQTPQPPAVPAVQQKDYPPHV